MWAWWVSVMSDKHQCRDCGRMSSDLYWTNVKGQKLYSPRCAACHEEALRSTQRAMLDHVEVAPGWTEKIRGVDGLINWKESY